MLACLALALVAPKLLVVDDLVIGAFDGKTWKKMPENSKSSESLQMRSVGFDSLGGTRTVLGYKESEIGGTFLNVDDFEKGVFVVGLTPKFPRKVTKLGTTNKTYIDVAAAALKAHKSTSKAALVAVYSVDLDGDGTQEVIIEGRSPGFTREQTMANDKSHNSLLIVRGIGKKGVQTHEIMVAGGPNGAMDFGTIRSIVDLDGDGKMEIIASIDYYEGQSASVYSWNKGVFKKILENGAGV